MEAKKYRAVEADIIGKLPDDLTLRAAINVYPSLFRQAPNALTGIRYDHKDIIIDMLLNKINRKTLEYFGLLSMGIRMPSKAVAVVPKDFVRSVIKASKDERFLNDFTGNVAKTIFQAAAITTSDFQNPPKFITQVYNDATREVFKVLIATGTLKVERENDDLVSLFKHAEERRFTRRSLHSDLPRNRAHAVVNRENFSLSRPVLDQLMHVYKANTKRELYQRVR